MAELERLSFGLDRVARVRPALVAADEIGPQCEQVDDLALALVAPLRPDDDGRGHGRIVPVFLDGGDLPPADAANSDSMTAPARREADVRVGPERALDHGR